MSKEKLHNPYDFIRKISLFYLSHFKINDEKFDKIVTEGQLDIFSNLIFRNNKYLEIICYTQYGKSLITALACLFITCLQKKVVCIVAPTKEKAKLIMRYYIEHLADHFIFYSNLEKETKLERLKQEENKERIKLKNGGGIFTVSVDQKNSKRSVEAAMGQGAEIVICDEAGLIEDITEATIFRMITGKKCNDKLYCKIGNPFYSSAPVSHFFNDWHNPLYKKIFIDYNQGIKEKRIQKEEIEIAKSKPLFNILYGCKFPSENIIDKDGYYKLVKKDWVRYGNTKFIILKMIQREIEIKREGKKEELKKIPEIKLGVDVARGKDSNVYIIRKGKYAFVAGTNQSENLMLNINEIIKLKKKYYIKNENIFIDDTGVGGGVTDRLKELGYYVVGVNTGSMPSKKEEFSNLKAELNWLMAEWLKNNGLLNENENWQQLFWLRYMQQSGDKKIIMESKQNLIKRTGKSPDYSDGLALTFKRKNFVGFV